MASTCKKNNENCHKGVLIINNSNKAIYFGASTRYPDTLTLYPNPTFDAVNYKVEGNSSKTDEDRSCYEDIVKATSQGILMYYIYDANTLQTVPWDTIVKNYMILKRYDLTLKDLQDKNWVISYP